MKKSPMDVDALVKPTTRSKPRTIVGILTLIIIIIFGRFIYLDLATASAILSIARVVILGLLIWKAYILFFEKAETSKLDFIVSFVVAAFLLFDTVIPYIGGIV